MKLLVLGDCHGRLAHVNNLLAQAQRLYDIDGAIQVGDFGFYPRTMHQFASTDGFVLPVYAIDGNHEAHDWLFSSIGAELQLAWKTKNLMVMPRGSTCVIDRATIGFCGGALNADSPQDLNVITDAQADAAVRSFNANPPDLMVTHSCPSGIGIGMRGHPAFELLVRQFIHRAGYNPGPADDLGEPGLTSVWNKLTIKPAHWVYGHWHVNHQRQIGQTVFTCVGRSDCMDAEAESRGQLPWTYDTMTKSLTLESTERLTGMGR